MKKRIVIAIVFFISVGFTAFKNQQNILNQKIGVVNGCTLLYNGYDKREGYTGSIKVFCRNKDNEKDLFNLTIADNYLSDVKLLHLKKNNFIYVGTTHIRT